MFAFLENKNLISYTFSMQPYKIIVLFLSFFILAAFCNTSAHEIRLESAVFQAQHALFEPVLKDIQDYYGRTSFEDENRQTGWYRVEDFLKWLKENEKILKYKTVRLTDKRIPLTELHSSPEKDDQKIFWGYLGAHYAFSRYGLNGQVLNRYTFALCKETKCYATPAKNTITLGGFNHLDSVAFFNMALHEAVHLFSTDLRKWDKHSSLPEAATCKAQNLWALPIKPKNYFFAGVRDFRVSYERGVPITHLMEEYTSCIVTPLYGMEIFESGSFPEEKSLCYYLEGKQLPALPGENRLLDAFAHQDFLSKFFGKEMWEKKLASVENGAFGSFGVASYIKTRKFYKSYFKQNKSVFNADDDTIKKELNTISKDPHISFLYKQGNKILFGFFPEEDLSALSQERLSFEFNKNEQQVDFYKKVIHQYYEEDFDCQRVVPGIIKLLDELAGPQTRAAVPPGYI